LREIIHQAQNNFPHEFNTTHRTEVERDREREREREELAWGRVPSAEGGTTTEGRGRGRVSERERG